MKLEISRGKHRKKRILPKENNLNQEIFSIYTNHIMMKKLTYKQYYNKVLGGWTGKCAGGILGAPIEGFKRFNNIPYSDALFATNFANDDLDLQVLWLDMLLKKGKKVRESDFKAH